MTDPSETKSSKPRRWYQFTIGDLIRKQRCEECASSILVSHIRRLKPLASVDDKKDLARFLICKPCAAGDRPWRCRSCREVFVASMPTNFVPISPTCPYCNATKAYSMVPPAGVHGDADKVAEWKRPLPLTPKQQILQAESQARARSDTEAKAAEKDRVRPPTFSEMMAKSNAEIAAKSEPAFRSATPASYLGGHPSAPNGEDARLGMDAAGINVYSGGTGSLLFSIPWPTLARVQHLCVPKGRPMDRSAMTVALYGASGRGGAVADWAAALGSLGSMFDRDKHLVTLVLQTTDGFEGEVGFESTDGEGLANRLTAERLRYGQQVPRPSQPQEPTTVDLSMKIRELSKLRDSGAITEAEYIATKTRLLDRM